MGSTLVIGGVNCNSKSTSSSIVNMLRDMYPEKESLKETDFVIKTTDVIELLYHFKGNLFSDDAEGDKSKNIVSFLIDVLYENEYEYDDDSGGRLICYWA